MRIIGGKNFKLFVPFSEFLVLQLDPAYSSSVTSKSTLFWTKKKTFSLDSPFNHLL